MFHNIKEVMQFIAEEKIEYVDFKLIDIKGGFKHLCIIHLLYFSRQHTPQPALVPCNSLDANSADKLYTAVQPRNPRHIVCPRFKSVRQNIGH